MEQEINVKKYVLWVLCAFVSFVIALNSFTIVGAGTTKVQTTFGTVNPQAFGEGVHFPVNPLSGFDVFDTRNARYEVEGLNIPTQDRFNSTANVTVLYRIDGAKTPYIKQNYGTAEEYIDKTLRQQLRSIVRDEGRKLLDSRSLAQSDNVTTMQASTTQRLARTLDGTGISIQEALVQDIEFDPRIANQILKTQERIQQEEEELSKKRIATTQALTIREKAKGQADKKREEADAEAYKINAVATAKKDAAIAQAQGQAEGIKLIADANLELTKSLTKQILEKQRLDNEAILYGKSKGNVPTTIIGDTDLRAIGVPMAAIK